MDTELPHDAAAMGFRRLDTDIQQAGHLSRAVTLGDQLQDLALAQREAMAIGAVLVAIGVDDDI